MTKPPWCDFEIALFDAVGHLEAAHAKLIDAEGRWPGGRVPAALRKAHARVRAALEIVRDADDRRRKRRGEETP